MMGSNVLLADTAPPEPGETMVASICQTSLFLIYPIIVLSIMLLPSVKAACNGRAQPPPGPTGNDEFGYERPFGKEDF